MLKNALYVLKFVLVRRSYKKLNKKMAPLLSNFLYVMRSDCSIHKLFRSGNSLLMLVCGFIVRMTVKFTFDCLFDVDEHFRSNDNVT